MFKDSEILEAIENSHVSMHQFLNVPFDKWVCQFDRCDFAMCLMRAMDEDALLEVYEDRDLFIDDNMKVINAGSGAGSTQICKNFANMYQSKIMACQLTFKETASTEQSDRDEYQETLDLELNP